MKKYFVFALIVITAFAACKNDNGKFTVEGKIKSAGTDFIYLEKLAYNSADSKIIDSAKLDKEGSYKLNGTDTQQNLYMLSVKHTPQVILVNDADKINIDLDINGFHYPDVSGSDGTKQLYDFIKNFWQKDSAIATTYNQLDSMEKLGITDTASVVMLQRHYTKQLMALGDVIKNFIHSSKDPASICFALDKAKGAMSPEDLTALAQDALKRFPQHSGIAVFKSSIEQQAAAANTTNTVSLIDKPAPDLTMPDVNGKNISISDFKGKYLLVDFWASWCGPCRAENPNVVQAYSKFKSRNFAILGVSLDEDKQAWKDAIKHDNLEWTQMSDLKQWESAAISAYHFDGIPFNVLIDPQGKVIAQSLRGPELEQKLSEVLQ